MNAAEKALQARSREQEARIMKTFEEAQKYREECISGYDDDTPRYDSRKSAFKKAIKLYTKCAEEGHVESMEYLGELYDNGSFDQRKSAFWYQRAAENDSMIGIFEMSWRYRDGFGGVARSDSAALKWETLLQNKLKELYDEGMQKLAECEKNFRSYSNGAGQHESELNGGDRALLYEAKSIFERCARCEHVKSMKALESIYNGWLDNHAMSMYWFSKWRSITNYN